MNFLNKLGELFSKSGSKTLVGKDRRGNQFFTVPHVQPGQAEKRLVDFNGPADPASLHPLWKHWLNHARESAPTDKDIYMWELEQVRLQKRLREIESASSKMKSEEMASKERGDSGTSNPFEAIMSQLASDREAAEGSTYGSYAPPTPHQTGKVRDFAVAEGDVPSMHSPHSSNLSSRYSPPSAPTGPAPGENLAFDEKGVPIIPKTHKPYSPDPSRLQAILNKNKAKTEPQTSTHTTSAAPASTEQTLASSTWNPNAKRSKMSIDEL